MCISVKYLMDIRNFMGVGDELFAVQEVTVRLD